MSDYGDGRDERLDAFALECRLRRDPEVTRRREDYFRRVQAAKDYGQGIGQQQMIHELCEANPAYIVSLLETEDQRHGSGALADRYAHTFYKRFE